MYVGRACPESKFNRTTLRAADPLLADPTGKIAVLESGGDQFNGCSFVEKVQYLAANGAIGVVSTIGGNFLNNAIPGPPGGIFPIPALVIQSDTFGKVTNLLPNRVLAGVTFPATYGRSSATNVTVEPFAAALACPASGAGSASVDACNAATNAAPITITATNHGLETGDRVAISGVTGNTAANGTFTVTVLNANQFTLDGSTGTGTWTGGGTIQWCLPTGPCTASPARTDFSRYRSVANGTDAVASGEVLPASRPAVIPGQVYRAGAFLEVAAHTSGSFRAAVRWYDSGGASLQVDELPVGGLSAVTPRTRFTRTLTAPANAATASLSFEWTGGGGGIAFADTLSLAADNAQMTIEDKPFAGSSTPEWGAQRIIDFSRTTPSQVGSYRSPTSKLWPPPDNGIYAPRQARMFGTNIAFTSWLSDGLRALDLSDPSQPKEVGSYVPPAVVDPSPEAGAGISNLDTGDPANLKRGQSWPNRPLVTGVGVIPRSAKRATVVVSDINGGLYVLDAEVDPVGPPPPPAPPPPPPPPPAAGKVAADTTAPTVTRFRLSRGRFSVGSAATALSGTAARALQHKAGATFSYRLSENATVRITIASGLAGKRKGTRCVKPTAALRRAKSCVRVGTKRGTLTRRSRMGANRVAFSGRLARKALKPGRYVATLVATDAAGNRSKARAVTFTVVKRQTR